MAFLEQRTRIPFIGIVAMVAIVGVVALFLRSGLNDVLPEAEITVTANEQNVRGSATYQGQRIVSLTYNEALEGVLVLDGESVAFLVDATAESMTVTHNGAREVVLLQMTGDGLGLTSTFEFDGQQVTATVYPAERSLSWRPIGSLTTTVRLAEVVRYTGAFSFNGQQYDVNVDPGLPGVVVRGKSASNVPLTAHDDRLSGSWRDPEGVAHPLEIDLERLEMTVSDLW